MFLSAAIEPAKYSQVPLEITYLAQPRSRSHDDATPGVHQEVVHLCRMYLAAAVLFKANIAPHTIVRCLNFLCIDPEEYSVLT